MSLVAHIFYNIIHIIWYSACITGAVTPKSRLRTCNRIRLSIWLVIKIQAHNYKPCEGKFQTCCHVKPSLELTDTEAKFRSGKHKTVFKIWYSWRNRIQNKHLCETIFRAGIQVEPDTAFCDPPLIPATQSSLARFGLVFAQQLSTHWQQIREI